MSAAEAEIVKKNEGQRILKNIKDGAYVIVLAINGKKMTSEAFSDFINERMVRGAGHIVFVIGGSLGVGRGVKRRRL